MAENNGANIDEADKGKASRGIFQRVSLRKTLELPQAIYSLGDGAPVRRRSVFEKLGRSADSGTSRTLVTTSGGYGLTKGAYNAEHLALTELGKEIVSTSDDALGIKLAHDVLFSNTLFAAFVTRFNDKAINNDEIGIDYLRADHKMSEDDAKGALSVFKENLHDYGLTKDFSGKTIVLSRQAAVEEFLKTHPHTVTASDSQQSDEPLQAPTDVVKIVETGKSGLAASSTQDISSSAPILNLKLRLPDNASPETYDAIFASMAKHLFGRADANTNVNRSDANNTD